MWAALSISALLSASRAIEWEDTLRADIEPNNPSEPIYAHDELALMPVCVLGENYAFEGTVCEITADLHTTMWNGGHHHFQGQPNRARDDGSDTTLKFKDQFYYIAPCSDMSVVDLPVTILGTHRQVSLEGELVELDYLVLELYDQHDAPTATHNIYLSSSIATYAARDTDGVSTDYDDTVADAPNALIPLVSELLTANALTAIGDRFSVLLTVTTDSSLLELIVDGEHTIKVLVDEKDNEVVIEQAPAFKCASCGLCGNFKDSVDLTSDTQQLERCDGSMVTFPSGDDADVAELYDPDGWTWEKNFVENECASADVSTVRYDIANNTHNGDDFEFRGGTLSNFVFPINDSYVHVGCWSASVDFVSVRADVMRDDLRSVKECRNFCADDYESFGVMPSTDAPYEPSLMCFCLNWATDFLQFAASGRCKRSIKPHGIWSALNSTLAIDVYEITVEALSVGDVEKEIAADIDPLSFTPWEDAEKAPEVNEDESASLSSDFFPTSSSSSSILQQQYFRSHFSWWSNEPKIEVKMLIALVSLAVMICVAGACRQCSSRKKYTSIAGEVSRPTIYGSTV